MANEHEKINYIEMPTIDIEATKHFFSRVFNWEFQDFGTAYCAFSNQGINGGFFQSKRTHSVENSSALIVFYSQNIEKTQSKIETENGVINKKIFSFPGGRRFHFIEPGGNEFGVWTEK